jgi:hypothetical protein
MRQLTGQGCAVLLRPVLWVVLAEKRKHIAVKAMPSQLPLQLVYDEGVLAEVQCCAGAVPVDRLSPLRRSESIVNRLEALVRCVLVRRADKAIALGRGFQQERSVESTRVSDVSTLDLFKDMLSQGQACQAVGLACTEPTVLDKLRVQEQVPVGLLEVLHADVGPGGRRERCLPVPSLCLIFCTNVQMVSGLWARRRHGADRRLV